MYAQQWYFFYNFYFEFYSLTTNGHQKNIINLNHIKYTDLLTVFSEIITETVVHILFDISCAFLLYCDFILAFLRHWNLLLSINNE